MHEVTFSFYGFSSNGSKVKVITLEDFLVYSKNLKVDKGKFGNGAIFAYNTGVVGNLTSTGGVLFIDVDHLTKQMVDKIMDNFEKIKQFGCGNSILAIQPSSSYYDPDRPDCGIHIFLKTNPIVSTKEDYEEREKEVKGRYFKLAIMGTAYVFEIIERCCDVQLRDYFDKHNAELHQRFFIRKCDYRYNEHATPFSENSLDERNWKELKKKYPDIFKFLNNKNWSKKNTKAAHINKDNVVVNVDSQRTAYPTHEERYKMVNVRFMEGWDYPEIYDEQLAIRRAHGGEEDEGFKRDMKGYWKYADNHKVSLTPQQYDQGRQLLREFGKLSVKKDKDAIEIPEGEYLSYDKDLIINKFEKYGRLLIQAPTGTGKTTLMKELVRKYNGVIIVPFNSMLRLYEDCCVIVGSGYDTEYTIERPVCMVWDRAMKYDLSNRLVISDETHQWFFDRTYRDSAVKTINHAKKWNKIICISATPAGEEEELNLHKLKFTKKRNIIRTAFVNSKNSGGFIKGLLDNRDFNTNYVVFSDRHAMKLYQNFPEGCLLHSEKRNTPEFKNVIRDERLSNSITFCTALAYNGLNFRNTGDYKVIIDVKEGEDTANKIIQAVGRLRNANIVEVTIVFTKNTVQCDSKRSVSEKVIDNNILKEFIERNNGKSIVDFDERYTEQDSIDALTTIEKYLISHSSKENIIADLLNEGYFSIQEYYDAEKHEKVNYVERDKSNVELKSILLEKGGCIDNIEYDELDNYQKKWIKRMNKINALVNVDWVRFINGRKMGSLLETLFEEVRLIYEVCRLTDEEFNFYYSDDKLNEISILKDSNGNRISDIGYKIVKNRFTLARKIRSIYELVNTYEVDPMERVLDEFMGIKEDSRIKSIKLKSEGGKKGNKKGKSEGGKKGKSITIQDNKGKIFHFDTYEECRIKKLDNCSTATFRNFLNGTSKYNKKYTIVND